ncbi:Hypothetical protein LUCI_2350 [Lucifera butyrica]|uniref:ASCH domain-containing protein n=1 Tax=Lucifera butyrica TaxID=1351585 RepID=A0A498R385_9FIRM|nr:ASCH domain-containing protein [Lucifera butyrica]VBB07106.1 Hypothetical protein LUCI_2350 [Lucifera butyrica]
MSEKCLLLSIHPEYVYKIFNGTKAIELRRTRPKIQTGDWVVVYATSPLKALYGMLQVEKVITSTPSILWETTRNVSGISEKNFFSYFHNTNKAYGIFISKKWALPNPLSLEELRQIIPGFRPPQGFAYLDSNSEIIRICKSLINRIS